MEITVVKVGGSLASNLEKLSVLMETWSELSKKHLIVIVPGGGEFADAVRTADKRFNLSCESSHRMAILGMDQFGILLADLTPNSVEVRTFKDAKDALDRGNLPIFLPSNMMFLEDPLENSWDVTSDSIALYIAHRLNASKVLLCTDVDGIFTADPKTAKNAELVKKISSTALLAMKQRTSVDKALPKLLGQWPIDCIVVNGLFPERLTAILEGKNALCTLISGKIL
jgi:5-(aminomethyl)-3-furanmethanol phosphate kinase